MTEPTAPPGWYDQPDRSRRYWDGTAWTEHVQLPTAAPQRKVYEGIRWLGVRWGRAPRPGLYIASAMIFGGQAIVFGIGVFVFEEIWWLHATVSGLAALASVAYALEAHFSRRVLREQV